MNFTKWYEYLQDVLLPYLSNAVPAKLTALHERVTSPSPTQLSEIHLNMTCADLS